ncbi:hypothetical protein AXA44_24590 [Rhodococcus sp. SC4]|nr:hypothetical protein AXA44_24590 [Rhodococcus sp. SC4]
MPGCTHRSTPLIAAICGAPFQTRRQPARRRRLGSREFDVTIVDEDRGAVVDEDRGAVVDEDSGAIIGRDRPHLGCDSSDL